MEKKATLALRYAFPKTIPVMVGYVFLGMAYGILMRVNGFGILWTLAGSLLVYAGSLQYVGVTLLASAANPVYAFMMGLMINARHLFYGVSMLGKYRDIKKFKAYLIFALTDETFSVVCNEKVPRGLDEGWVYLWISALNQCYWVLGSVAGSLVGSMIRFNTKGLDFALTALFVVIFTDQWKNQNDHKPALAGVAASVACVIVFGADSFIVPAMVLILAILSVRYQRSVKRGVKDIG
ncbi:MAG: branched-chain amino acid ABC transporter permease [Hungatella sp.]|nr:branched-chain amino acid ABC transporter permease [Hungatella sp.]